MAYTKRLQRYGACLYPNHGKQTGRINLYCSDNHKLYLLLADPSDPMPVNTYNASTTTGVAYQRYTQYQHYLDLIRNEEPIYITFSPEDTPPKFAVFCASEPPGEGEI